MLRTYLIIFLFIITGTNECLSIQLDEDRSAKQGHQNSGMLHQNMHHFNGSLQMQEQGRTLTRISRLGNFTLNQLQTCINAIKILYEADVELKATWSYQTLTLARTVSLHLAEQVKDASYISFFRTLSCVITQHFSPQIFITIGNYFIPNRLRDGYEQTIKYAFAAAQAYVVAQDPLKHSIGYVCGFVGVYLITSILDETDDPFFQKELKGIAYFCCREAGWKVHETYSSYLLSFFESLPTYMQRTLFDEEVAITINPTLLDLKQKQVNAMDDNVTVKGKNGNRTQVIISACENPQLRERAIDTFNTTVVPKLLDAYLKASNGNLSLAIIWGQQHYSCGCYWQERELLKWAQSLGIKDLVYEAGRERLTRWMEHVKELRSLERKLDSFQYDGDLAGISRLIHARQLNFAISVGDPYVDIEVPLWDAYEKEYFTYLSAIHDRKIPRSTPVKIWGFPVDLTKCPDFSGRDRLMAVTLKSMPRSKVGMYGVAHLGGIHHFLDDYTKAIVIYISCWDERGFSTFFERIMRYFVESKRATLLNSVFGKGCGQSYVDAYSRVDFFYNSPDVIRAIVPEDNLFYAAKRDG